MSENNEKKKKITRENCEESEKARKRKEKVNEFS